jgi:hypothetical protein
MYPAFSGQMLYISLRHKPLPEVRNSSLVQPFFQSNVPNASFKLTGFTGSNSTRHVSWTATSPSGTIKNGSDTIGCLEGKIVYHYTYSRLTSPENHAPEGLDTLRLRAPAGFFFSIQGSNPSNIGVIPTSASLVFTGSASAPIPARFPLATASTLKRRAAA